MEEEGSELNTRRRYYLLGPCYHLVRNVQIKEETTENKDLPADKMGETEATEVRDIKKEKVKCKSTYINRRIYKPAGASAVTSDSQRFLRLSALML